MAKNFEEKRMYPRMKTLLVGRYSYESGNGVAWVRDISYGGVCLFVDKPIETGAVIRIDVHIPKKDLTFKLKGEVIFSSGDIARVQFIDADIILLNRIFNVLQNISKAGI